MSRTEDRYRAKDAEKKGYYAGLSGEPRTNNPYKVGAAAGTWTAWDIGWGRGKSDARKRT